MSEEIDFADDSGMSLSHIGIKRRSGRYPWGSGKDPLQRSHAFKTYYDEMKKAGLSDGEVVQALRDYANAGRPEKEHVRLSSTDLRAAVSQSTDIIRGENIARAVQLRNDRQMSATGIGKVMGVNESVVRGWLKASETQKESSLRATVNMLKENLERGNIDVGAGTELYLGITTTKLRTALKVLEDEGYPTWNHKIDQLGTDKQTNMRVLCKPGTTWKESLDAIRSGDIVTIADRSEDGGLTFLSPEKIGPKALPVSFDSKKLMVRYGDEGGASMDGVIEVRRGVEELSLGAKNYAQVRIAVDGSHYLKGMAMYADDLPDGVNIRFNTNKTREQAPGKLDALKPLKRISDDDGNDLGVDARNPFGATTRPKVYLDKNGKEKTSPLNMVNEEGAWDEWSRSLSSQMLSKQSLRLAAKQLGETQKAQKEELDSILALTNPVVKRKLLDEYASNADAAAVHLKAAAMKDQSTHVILPMNNMRPNEIYARNFNDGDKVVLVRYPHGGPFEIPELTVNNKSVKARRLIGEARDAVGIHASVAAQLSGADFDGDTVLVIRNNTREVKARPPLKQLEGYEPKEVYPEVPGMKYMTKASTQREMGNISNLITDMTIKNATDEEISRAVKHSMVVIDAEKHKLNYTLSAQQNRISELKHKYQEGPGYGASTLISRSSSDARVPERKYLSGDRGIDPDTGKRLYVETGATREIVKRDASGAIVKTKVEALTTKGSKMEFTDDARTLSSGTPMEELYASHANTMKGLANQARKELVNTPTPPHSKAAKAIYSEEVKSLEAKLERAQRNAPVERRAQVLGGAMARARIDSNPNLDKDDIKKIRYQSLDEARLATGANKVRIGTPASPLTDREWEAVQAGAIPTSTLVKILSNSDMKRVRELATPRPRSSLTVGQQARIRQMASTGRSPTEIAQALGIPRSTVVGHIE